MPGMESFETRIRQLEEALALAATPELWEEARALYKAEPSEARPALLLRLYGLASVLCFEPGDPHFDKGRSLLRQAARRFEAQGQLNDAALSGLYQAKAERKLGQLDQEVLRLQEAFAAAQWGDAPDLVARALHALGLAQLEGRRTVQAERALEDLQAATISGQGRWRWHHLRARILESAGDLRLAARELSRARTLLPTTEPDSSLALLLADAQGLKHALEKANEVGTEAAP